MNLGLVGMDPRISLFLPCPCFVQTHASVGRNVNSNKPQTRPAASSQAELASSELQSGVKQPVTRQWRKKMGSGRKMGRMFVCRVSPV